MITAWNIVESCCQEDPGCAAHKWRSLLSSGWTSPTNILEQLATEGISIIINKDRTASYHFSSWKIVWGASSLASVGVRLKKELARGASRGSNVRSAAASRQYNCGLVVSGDCAHDPVASSGPSFELVKHTRSPYDGGFALDADTSQSTSYFLSSLKIHPVPPCCNTYLCVCTW